VSPYGVYDMTGNVDEWVLNEDGSIMGPEYESGLKGGYWARVRNRCRPMTTDHNRWHSGYQIGYRCCSNAQSLRATAEPPPAAENRVAGPRANESTLVCLDPEPADGRVRSDPMVDDQRVGHS
jgi:hypothetical protein